MQSMHQCRKALAAGVDGDVRNFAVERIAHFIQFIEPGAGVCSLQKRPILVVSRAIDQVLHARPQIDDGAPASKLVPVLLRQHCATAADHFYDATTEAALQMAYRDIALKIATLRLTN